MLNAQEYQADAAVLPNNETFVTLQVMGINSIGEFKNNWESAAGAYIGIGIIYSDHAALILQTGFIDFKVNENSEYTEDPVFSIIPIMIGGRYYVLLDRFRPYFLAMNGINIISQKYTDGDTSVDETRVHYNFQVGLGLSILIAGNVQIDAAFKYNSHLFEPSTPYNITGLEYSIGLNWQL
jgi:opacity protein-like surface antigen